MLSKTIVFAFIGILAFSSIAFALTITTSVRFRIPVDTAFAITIPSNNATYVTSSTPGILFNSTSTTITMINATMQNNESSSAQTSGTAILRYRNDGNVRLNITLEIGGVPSCVTLKAGNDSVSWQSTCTSVSGPPNTTACISWNSTDTGPKNVTNGLATTATDDVWLWADFSSCTAGLDNTTTITHTGKNP